jgi:hypothetical protein
VAPISAEEVVRLHSERRKARLAVINRAEDVRAAYNADYVLPSPELRPGQKAQVANLIQLGIDQTGMRVASTTPSIFCPPDRPGVRRSEDEAATVRRAMYGWWKANEMGRKKSRRARHLVAYASSPVLIRPWSERGIPRWLVRDPLSTFPADGGDLDDMCPPDCVFAFRRSLRWLRDRYPQAMTILYKGRDPRPDDLFDVLEYVDGDQFALVVAGRAKDQMSWDPGDNIFGVSAAQMLEWTPNRAGVCTAVVPGRVTLDRPLGQFDGALGVYVKMARLEALEEIGIERGVLPEQWIVSPTGQKAQIINYADARTGDIGELAGGTLEMVRLDPSLQTPQAIDRQERYLRQDARIPADWTGESASNVRTDRRGNSITAATVDHTIAEAQQALASSDEHELRIAVATAKGWFGSQRKTFWVDWSGAKGQVDYVPDRDFNHAVAFVKYALPGSDVNGLAVAGGQRIAMGTLDPFTFMELDPLVDDPEQVRDRVIEHQLQTATLASFGQQMAAGQVSPEDVAWFAQQVLAHKMSFFQAFEEVHKRAQERQSQTVNPAAAGSPEAQAGLAAPGAGAESGIEGPEPAQAPLTQALRDLHTIGTAPRVTPAGSPAAA